MSTRSIIRCLVRPFGPPGAGTYNMPAITPENLLLVTRTQFFAIEVSSEHFRPVAGRHGPNAGTIQ